MQDPILVTRSLCNHETSEHRSGSMHFSDAFLRASCLFKGNLWMQPEELGQNKSETKCSSPQNSGQTGKLLRIPSQVSRLKTQFHQKNNCSSGEAFMNETSLTSYHGNQPAAGRSHYCCQVTSSTLVVAPRLQRPRCLGIQGFWRRLQRPAPRPRSPHARDTPTPTNQSRPAKTRLRAATADTARTC